MSGDGGPVVVEMFSGIRGWSEGMRRIRPDLVDTVVGFEWNVDACLTAAAAGHHTVRADVAGWPLGHLLPVAGLIASPPCQTFSAAGNGEGRDDIDRLVWHAHRGMLLETPDPRTGLVLEPLRWIHALHPRWVAMEQVPAVAPVWHAYEHHFHGLGYATWSGICNAADHGVPQTRRRAILLASLDRRPGRPVATHERNPDGMFGLLPWVSMADALGWDEQWATGQETTRGAGMSERYGPRPVRPASEPSEVISSKARSWTVSTGMNSMSTSRDPQDMVPYERSVDEPAPTVDRKAGSSWQIGEPGHRNPPMSWKVHTNRGQEPDGTRQTVGVDRPAPSLTGKSGGQWEMRFRVNSLEKAVRRSPSEPAPSLTCGHSTPTESGWYADDDVEPSIRLTVADALTLQDFPPDYPVRGSRTSAFQQVGNAIPPGLAAAVLAQVLG